MTDPREIAEMIADPGANWNRVAFPNEDVVALARAFLALADDEAALREALIQSNRAFLAQQPVIDAARAVADERLRFAPDDIDLRAKIDRMIAALAAVPPEATP